MAEIDITLEKSVWEALESVKDPEIPAISVVDLGVVTDVEINEGNKVTVTMTPTFTGCPAIHYMQSEIKKCVEGVSGVSGAEVKIDFKRPWSSNSITERGKQQLKDFGLAPPPRHRDDVDLEMLKKTPCPHCGSANTELRNPFGPTLCRSIHYCNNCLQAFQQFKPL